MKEKFFEQVIRLRIPIIVLFIIVALAGAVGRQEVSVNYDMNDYLPPESLSTVSLDKMHEEFTGDKGVGEVTWLDDQNPMDINDTVPRISVFLVLPGMLYVTDRQKNKI